MKILVLTLIILIIVGCAICYKLGYWDWEEFKKYAHIYLLSWGIGANIYFVYFLITGI